MVELLAEFVIQCLSKDFSNIQTYNNMEELGGMGEITGPAPRLQLSSGGPTSASKELDPAIRTEDNAPAGFEAEGGELAQHEEEKLVDATFAPELAPNT